MMKIDNNYWKNFLSVALGAGAAQIIPILGSLLLARMFEPSLFGFYSAWLAIVILLSICLTGRFEASLVNISDNKERSESVVLIGITAIIATILSLIIFSIFILFFYQYFKSYTVLMIILLLPTALLLSLFQICISYAAANGVYNTLNIIRIVNAASITLFQLLFGFVSTNVNSLIIGYFLGVSISVIFSYNSLPITSLSINSIPKKIIKFWILHYKFPLYSLPADALNAGSAQLPVLLVSLRFGAESAGLLAMATRTMGAPISLIGRSILDVFKRYAAISYQEFGQCREIYIKTMKALLVAALLFSICIFLFAEFFFELTFGLEWRSCGTISIILIPMFAFGFVASPLSYIIYIAGKQRHDLVWQFFLLIITFITLSVSQSFYSSLFLYGILYSFMYLIYIRMSYIFSCGNKN